VRNHSPRRPLSVTILVGLIVLYAAVVIGWDLVAPFERPYARGPVSVVLGRRVFGVWAQLMHVVQLAVAMTMAAGLWMMRRWGWQLVEFVAWYMVLSCAIWLAIYQEYHRIGFALLYLVVANLMLALTFPHREKFV
jgi:hypothetical protein